MKTINKNEILGIKICGKTRYSFLFSFIFLTLFVNINGQEKRNFIFNQKEISYYVFPDMSSEFMKFPNHKAEIIIVDQKLDLLEAANSNFQKNKELHKNKEKIYYYLKLTNLKDEKNAVKFLRHFIDENYRKDFFDRNTLSIHFPEDENKLNCQYLDEMNGFLAKIIVSENSPLLKCNKPFVLSQSNHNQTKTTTTIHYESITLREAEDRREHHQLKNELPNWKKNFFISLSLGRHTIDHNTRTNFDDETLVNVADTHSIWHITSGYMFTNKVGTLLDFGFMISKNQFRSFDGVSFSGTGNGLGLFTFGIGARYIPFAKNRWSIYADAKGGLLILKISGGSGSFNLSGGSTRNITEKNEKTNYLSLGIGANYRLGKVVFLNSNIEYTSSKFKRDLGSVSGISGYTVNLGIGFSFK